MEENNDSYHGIMSILFIIGIGGGTISAFLGWETVGIICGILGGIGLAMLGFGILFDK